jgi:hypothetical protein
VVATVAGFRCTVEGRSPICKSHLVIKSLCRSVDTLRIATAGIRGPSWRHEVIVSCLDHHTIKRWRGKPLPPPPLPTQFISMPTHEASLAGDHRNELAQLQRCKSGTTSSASIRCSTELECWRSHSQCTKTSKDLSAAHNLVGAACESGPHPAVRYVYHPYRPSSQRSTRFTSPCDMPKERNYHHATSAGSFTHVVFKDMENEKTQSPLLKPPPPPPPPARSMILVSPGHEARLRGAAETWQAIQQDFYLACVCFDCQATLFCILDAWLVLCPHCRVISPIYQNNGDVATNQDGGVGLGFTFETLVEAQATDNM